MVEHWLSGPSPDATVTAGSQRAMHRLQVHPRRSWWISPCLMTKNLWPITQMHRVVWGSWSRLQVHSTIIALDITDAA